MRAEISDKEKVYPCQEVWWCYSVDRRIHQNIQWGGGGGRITGRRSLALKELDV